MSRRFLVVAPNRESADNRTTLDNQAFGEFLRSLRLAAGLTQKEVVEKLYLTLPYLRMFEKGQRVPHAGQVSNLCYAYGVKCERVDRSLSGITLRIKNTETKFLPHWIPEYVSSAA